MQHSIVRRVHCRVRSGRTCSARAYTGIEMTARHGEAEAIKRWRLGQVAAARRKLELCAEEGPDPEQAVAEALAAFTTLSRRGSAFRERDPVSARGVAEVRRRWARIQKRAQKKS
jgi:hypothetical protein